MVEWLEISSWNQDSKSISHFTHCTCCTKIFGIITFPESNRIRQAMMKWSVLVSCYVRIKSCFVHITVVGQIAFVIIIYILVVFKSGQIANKGYLSYSLSYNEQPFGLRWCIYANFAWPVDTDTMLDFYLHAFEQQTVIKKQVHIISGTTSIM